MRGANIRGCAPDYEVDSAAEALKNARFGNLFLEALQHPRINAQTWLNISQARYAEDIAAIAATVSRHEILAVPQEDHAVVHVRCSDSPFNRHNKYHLQFKEYYAWVAGHINGTVSRVHFVMCPHHDVDPRRWRKIWGLSGIPEFTYTADDFRSKCASFADVIRGWFAELLPVPIYIEPVTCLSNEASVNLLPGAST